MLDTQDFAEELNEKEYTLLTNRGNYMRMLKICFVTTVYGTFRTFIRPLCDYLYETEKFEMSLICDNKDSRMKGDLPDYIAYYPIPMKRGIDFCGIGIVLKMITIFKSNHFDIVQYTTPNASLYASIASKIAKVPVQLYFQWGIRYSSMNGIKKRVFKSFEKLVCSLSTEIRVASKKNMEYAVTEKLYRDEKAMVIGHGGTIGVDLNEYRLINKAEYRNSIRKHYAIHESDIVFGFAGRITSEKGCNELLVAFRKLLEVTQNVKLFIIGPFEDDKQLSSQMIEWAQNNSNVIFTGRRPKQDMVQYYSAMDVYIHPTYREGFGMVLQEAAAMELAIITSDVPGASEVMVNGVSCFLVPPKNVTSLCLCMEYLIKNDDIRLQLGKEARKRVEMYFERSVMLSNQHMNYNDIYMRYFM